MNPSINIIRLLFKRNDVSIVALNWSVAIACFAKVGTNSVPYHCQFPLAIMQNEKMHRRSLFDSIKIGYQPKRLHILRDKHDRILEYVQLCFTNMVSPGGFNFETTRP